MRRVLLVLPSSTYRAAAFLDAARRLGADVVTGSDTRQALAGVMGDHFVQLDLDDPEAAASSIVRLAGRLPIDAVVAVDDVGSLTATIAAERLGLPHNPLDAVAATRDKAAMRARLDTARVAQPAWRAVAASPSSSAAERAVDAARELGFPAVVKPCSLSGSRGVIRADDPDEARAAAVRARRILADAGGGPDEPLLVEEFVPGAELAVEGIVRSGVFEALALFDKPDPLDGPFFEETIYVTPARLDEGTVAAVTRLVGDAVAAIGLREGPVHAEVRVATGDRGPVLLEAASRTIGGNCARALRFATGASLEEIVLAHYLGIPSPAPPDSEASGVVMIPIPRTGRLVAVRGLDRARAVEHVTGAEISIPPGRLVRALPEGDRYLGFAFARAETPDLVEAALRAALAELEIEIEIEAA